MLLISVRFTGPCIKKNQAFEGRIVLKLGLEQLDILKASFQQLIILSGFPIS